MQYPIYFVGAIIMVFSNFLKPAEPNCGIYRLGKFYIINKATRQIINIERRDSLQIETNRETGDITVMNVKWTGDCEYELLFNYMTPKDVSTAKEIRRIIETSVNIPLRIKILSGTDSYYVFEAGKEGFQNLRDTVWLVK